MDAKTRFDENTSLVFLVLHKHFNKYVWDEDIQQIGKLGLWKACLNFDENKGYQFSTFASCCIRNEVLMSLRSQRKVSRLPTSSIDKCINEDFDETFSSFLEDKNDYNSHLEISDSLNYVLSEYTERDKRIIELHLNSLDQTSIGKEVGCSQPQVSRIIKRFKKDMEVELYEDSRR